MNSILQGDCLDKLKEIEESSVDLVCTDPPYGYSFMGRDWDKAVPSVEVWRECLRVLKPGAFAFVMSAPRSDVQCAMISRLQDAGFRLDFTPIYWTYASGFPKAMNIGKMVDKRDGRERKNIGRNPNSRENATKANSLYEPGTVGKTAHLTAGSGPLEGSYGGFQPKPAVEIIIVAMKPLSEKTFVDQALKNGKGITWLDDCRVPISGETVPRLNKAYERKGGKNFGDGDDGRLGTTTGHESAGRFPANLLVSDDVLNDGRITKSTDRPRINSRPKTEAYGVYQPDTTGGHADSGSYSRFFSLDAWAKTLPFLLVPKASKREKGKENRHPTVKPLTLMSYLITLGSRTGDVVLDPFLGSGTTAVAAKQLGRQFIGIEREKEYVAIAEARLQAVPPTLI